MPSTVTVVVPAHNEEASVAATVAAIRAQTHPVSRILVVDDGSTDATAAQAIAAGAEVLAAPGGSKPRAQNLALATVDTDVVVGVDADTIVAPDAVERLVDTIEAGAHGTCGAVLPAQRRGIWVKGRAFEYAVVRGLGRMHVLSGALYAFRTETLRAVGGHPEVPIGEDTELTWRLYAAGYRLAYSPKAVAFTQEPETFGEFWRQNRRWAASSAQVIRRHWRQLSHPGRALMVTSAVWDYLGVFFLGLMAFFGLLRDPALGRFIGPWVAIMMTVSTAVAARSLGWRYAVACLPPRLVTSAVARSIYATTYLREWVLGRHYLSWTGRQSTSSVISPMSSRRRVAFSGLTGAGALVLVLAALETSAVVTGQPSPTRQALEYAAPGERSGGDLSQPSETSPSTSRTVAQPSAPVPVAARLPATSSSRSGHEPATQAAGPHAYALAPAASPDRFNTPLPGSGPSVEGSSATTTPTTATTKPLPTTVTTPPTTATPTTATPTTTTTTGREVTTTTSAPAPVGPPAALTK